jgi:hypothetical protein
MWVMMITIRRSTTSLSHHAIGLKAMSPKRSTLVLRTRRERSVEVLGLVKVNAAYTCFLSGVLSVDTPAVSSEAFLLPIDDGEWVGETSVAVEASDIEEVTVD